MSTGDFFCLYLLTFFGFGFMIKTVSLLSSGAGHISRPPSIYLVFLFPIAEVWFYGLSLYQVKFN